MTLLGALESGVAGVLSLNAITAITPLLLLMVDVYKSTQSVKRYEESHKKTMEDDLRVLVQSDLETGFFNLKLRFSLV